MKNRFQAEAKLFRMNHIWCFESDLLGTNNVNLLCGEPRIGGSAGDVALHDVIFSVLTTYVSKYVVGGTVFFAF
jgi:hypothetical protein